MQIVDTNDLHLPWKADHSLGSDLSYVCVFFSCQEIVGEQAQTESL